MHGAGEVGGATSGRTLSTAGLAILLLQLMALCPFCQWDTMYPSLLSLLTEQLVSSSLCARGFMVLMMLWYFGCVGHTNLMHI